MIDSSEQSARNSSLMAETIHFTVDLELCDKQYNFVIYD